MTSVTNRRRDILGKLSVQPGFGLLRNLFRIPCTFSPASGCCATYSAFLARSARLRVAAQLIPHSLHVQPGFGLLRNSFRIPCPFSPASGCCATHSAFLARSARLRVAAQLFAVAGFTLAVANFRSGLRLWLARA